NYLALPHSRLLVLRTLGRLLARFLAHGGSRLLANGRARLGFNSPFLVHHSARGGRQWRRADFIGRTRLASHLWLHFTTRPTTRRPSRRPRSLSAAPIDKIGGKREGE
ncbi:hypothetical protein PFISCL1PPCAC_16417, partial [Pristionchus fissidentatus]